MDRFGAWFASLKPMKQYGGRPAKGTIAAALIVLERLRDHCDLRLEGHVAQGGAQISGMSHPALKKILARSGESREFPSEGGRTNRGNNTPVRQLLDALAAAGLASLNAAARTDAIDQMQRFLVQSLDAYFLLERIRIDFDALAPARSIVSNILGKARDRSQAGPVAQHIVGAKLAVRFPEMTIDNFSFSAADNQSGRPADFKVVETAIHVTVAPTPALADRCRQNIRDGLLVFVIVPDDVLAKARLRIDDAALIDRVAVESLESFVGQNISELSAFSSSRARDTLGDLLREYNRRVSKVETDGSLLIEIPPALDQSPAPKNAR